MSACPSLTQLPPNPPMITASMMKYLIVNTYLRSVGTVVNVRCQPGLTLVGPSSVTCMQSGFWSGDPYCIMPNEITTATTTIDDEKNTMILIIVLGVVGFLVAALIVFVVVALYCGRIGNKKSKQYRDSTGFYMEESSSHPYSISRKADDSPPRYNGDGARLFHDDSDRHRYYDNNMEGYDNQVRDEEYRHHGDYEGRYHHRPGRRHFQGKYNSYTSDVDDMRQAYSLNDLDDEKQYEIHRDGRDGERHIRDNRRDRYLWRRRSSISDLNIPRPYYDTKGASYYAVYYGKDYSSPYI